MIKFLLERPIAVIMVFIGFVCMGVVTFSTLPVSLLPDIPIPEITVQVAGDNVSARELENTVVKPIREQLMQVGRVRDIRSETSDGVAIIRLKFDYGTDTDLSFIEVNEKIDGSMNRLPRNIDRPRVIKASATDIPVFYLNLTLRDDTVYSETDEQKFISLSNFAENIAKRRIEQLAEVAMVDMTGLMYQQIRITPNMNFLESAGIRLSDIERLLASNNIEPGSMVVRDGYYEYNIKFASVLRTLEDIENIYLRKGDRLFKLKDLAEVDIVKEHESGFASINGKRSITLGVIKQADETMQNLKVSINRTLSDMEMAYPDVEFTVNRNQTELLDYTINNLKGNLFIGFILIFIVAFLFLGDIKSPIIIGVSMLTSLIISFLFFYLFKQSLNIISLSGMILALGMMIDSAIVVTDIITQYRESGLSLKDSCIKGTNEVITPILSSTFTTISVFIPLVFLSGIAGAIFFDQAFAVSVGLLVSYFTGIMLLPVLYYIVYSKKWLSECTFFVSAQRAIDKVTFSGYDKGFKFIFRYKLLFFTSFVVTLPICVVLFNVMPKSNMPFLDQVESIVKIEWNENIHVSENGLRVNLLLQTIDESLTENSAYIGEQQYLLNKDNALSISEAQLYLRGESADKIELVEERIGEWMRYNYPLALLSFAPPESVFEKIFDTDEPEIITELYVSNRQDMPEADIIRELQTDLANTLNEKAEGVAFDEQFLITVNKENLLRFGVEYSEVQGVLKAAFKDNEIATLRSYQYYLPITLSCKEQTINEILQETLIYSYATNAGENIQIPLKSLITVRKGEGIKSIVSGKNGEYIPFIYSDIVLPEELIDKTKEFISKDNQWDVQFSGSFFSSQKMLSELVVVLFVSILLMYFILAAQFESFVQPLIVLTELPIDISFALVLLWATGHTLNLMSAIGIVVACGVIINDSILKIDMINELRKQGVPIMEAIHTAGVKRLRAILMTSLTTILGMVPLLFAFDMGSELQKPLAIAMIGTMLIGTLVSLFIIPLIYWMIYRK